jgi:uncharacterized membrane protein
MIARNWKWIAGTVVVAAVVHVASLLALPRLLMLRTMTAITRSASANTIIYPPQPTARARGVVRPCPDPLYSIGVYDLNTANRAVGVSTHDLPNGYWSVSVFDADTDNFYAFYALSDRQAKTGAADFLLVAQRASAAAIGLPVITAPTSRGIVLFRTLIDDERRLGEIDGARRHADCTPYRSS